MSDRKELDCALCGQTISEEEYDFCIANTGRFHGLHTWKCWKKDV